MGLVAWMRWSNPPTSGGMELVVDALIKEYSAVVTSKSITQATSYRANFPVPQHRLPPPPPPTSRPTASQPTPTYDRTLHTIVHSQSPYLYALVEDPLPQEGKERQLCFGVTPASSLNSLLVVTKSGFVLPPKASGSAGQMMDMGTNSAKAVRAQIATVKLDFFCYDVPLVRLGLGGQISFVPGGIKPEMEFSVKIGMGAAGKGILVEAEYLFPPSAPPLSQPPLQHLESFLRSLLPIPTSVSTPIVSLPRPPISSWKAIGVQGGNGSQLAEDTDESRTEREQWDDTVERGRRSAFILISVLRAEGMI